MTIEDLDPKESPRLFIAGEIPENGQYGVIVIVCDDKDYPFNNIEKMNMRNAIAETVYSTLAPGTVAQILTMDL